MMALDLTTLVGSLNSFSRIDPKVMVYHNFGIVVMVVMVVVVVMMVMVVMVTVMPMVMLMVTAMLMVMPQLIKRDKAYVDGYIKAYYFDKQVALGEIILSWMIPSD